MFKAFDFRSYLIQVFVKLLGIVLAVLLTACTGHKVLLEIPPFDDKLPEIATGFYTVHKITDGNVSEETGTDFLGELVYLYKDDIFIDGNYFSGIKGSFLPNYFIKTDLKNSQSIYYWQDAEDEEKRGSIIFNELTLNRITAVFNTDNNEQEEVEFRFYSNQLWQNEVGTIPIAHRGLCYQPPANYDGIFPANTSPGFEAALRSGYQGFELDVRVTKDKRFMISHDEDLSAATTMRGEVKDKNLSEFENALVIKSAAIPENKSTAKEAFIAAPMKSLYKVFYHFIDDPRLKTFVVDVKPDTDENIYAAAKHDFEGLSIERQKKILFLTRNESTAIILKELCPYSDVALEGSIGIEPVDELEKFFPEAVNLPRAAHNTVSFGSNWILAFKSIETSIEMIKTVMDNAKKYNYKICMWTFSKEWRFNFLREHEFYPDFILSDVPYYQYALQQLRYTKEKNIKLSDSTAILTKYSNPIYKRVYKQYVGDFWFQSRTIIELTYGIGKPRQSNFTGSFAPVGNWELKLGRSELDKFSQTNASLNEWYTFVSYINTSSALGKVEPNEVSTKFYRFGFGRTEGLGYFGLNHSFIPYVSQSLLWTKLDDYGFTQNSSETDLSTNDEEIINRYVDAFRFSDRVLYGFKFDILSSVQLVANYETSIIYPRHLVLKWTVSFILAQAGYRAIDYALGKFVDDYPVVGPIINMIVKSGYLYCYYLVRKENMNWPFSTEAPLRYEAFNLGISLLL
jgi:glycerophosphoryl diester phosphodiesterase